jgi:hypothetical protein
MISAFVVTDVIAAGRFTLGQTIELQAQHSKPREGCHIAMTCRRTAVAFAVMAIRSTSLSP